MPEENWTTIWMWQGSQQSSTSWGQTGNDFVLDFWDLWNDNMSAIDNVEVESSLSEEESSWDELGFDIDLWSNYDNVNKSSDEWVGDETKNENKEEEDSWDQELVWEDNNVNDFDISMEYEWGNEEVLNNEKTVLDNEEAESDNKEIEPEGKVQLDDGKLVSDDEIKIDNDENIPSDKEEIEQNSEETLPMEETTKSSNLEMIINNNEENLDMSWEVDESTEWHLFHQINEDDQNETSFQGEYLVNENLQNDENSENKPLFITDNTDNETLSSESESWSWELVFDLPKVSDDLNTTAILEEEPEQKQPEIGDLLSNAPINLSEDSIDVQANEENESNLLEWSESENNIVPGELNPEEDIEEIKFDLTPEMSSEWYSDDSTMEPDLPTMVSKLNEQVEIPEQVSQPENNEFLLDAPQEETKVPDTEQVIQSEAVENNTESVAQEEQIQSQELPQSDERSEAVNNMVWQLDEQKTNTTEVNLSIPVELSSESSNQTEKSSVESDMQVQSTLSLDQILDSELLTNPQYADNSKASPQNVSTSSWSKAKMGIFVGVWVAALACCVAVLAFPSLSWDRKPWDTVNTWTIIDNPTWEPHPSASSEPDWRQVWWDTSIVLENPSEDPEITDTSIISWDVWSATAVSFPEWEEDEWGDDNWNQWWEVQPMPYVGYGDEWDIQEDSQDTISEELDKNQVLDTISSFKLQAEQYYKLGQDSLDKQLMKYSLRLMNLCDKYSVKVDNWEWMDAESYSSFKSSANKFVNLINKYMGWEDDVPVIQANISADSDFEWKDEIKEYIYNNR